jgi:hypothetical protein
MIKSIMSFASKNTLHALRAVVYGALVLSSIVLYQLPLSAQTVVALMPIPKPQFFYPNGAPLAGGKLYFYETGTSIPLGTFTDYTGTIANPNPVTLDAGGFVNPGVWLIVGDTYRISVFDMNGVQQYIIDGIVGVGGGSLSIFSTPNTFTATQTFTNGIILSGASNFSGTIAGSPSFLGTPGFVTFSVSNPALINNLNAQYWNGTSVTPAGGSLTTGFVPVISGGAAATWSGLPAIAGVATLSQLPGAGVTSLGSTSCTIGAACGSFVPSIVYHTASASTNANIAATTMTTVGANPSTYIFSYYANNSVVGAGCSGPTTIVMNLSWNDPVSGGAESLSYSAATIASTNGTLNAAGPWDGTWNAQQSPVQIRAAAGTAITYTVTYSIGSTCSPGPQYQVFPILQYVSAN